MRTLLGIFIVSIAVVFATGPYPAQASSLLTTGQAFGGWQGTQHYTGALLSDTLDADVEYAVFAPGKFQNFLDENSIVYNDPTAGGEYIYAYQIVNIDPNTTPVTTFTVGMNGNESPGNTGVTYVPAATDYGTYPYQPTQDPGATGGGPGVSTSAVWPTATGSPYTPGEVSAILFYSSPQVPELGLSTVLAGFAGEFPLNSMPNPVPEPATLFLGLAAGIGLAMRRRSR